MKTVPAPSSTPMRDRGVDPARNDRGSASQVQSGPGAGPSPAAATSAPGCRHAAPEVDAGRAERRRTMDHDSGLLDEFHELSLGMVEGWLGEGDLHRLASLVEQTGRRAGERNLP